MFSQRLIRQLKVRYQFGFYCDCIYGNVGKSKFFSKSKIGVNNEWCIKQTQNRIYLFEVERPNLFDRLVNNLMSDISLCFSACLFSINLYVCLFVYLFYCLLINFFICCSNVLSIYIRLFLFLSFYLYINMFVDYST